jgi:PhzF family phenazine biosynthesis protein
VLVEAFAERPCSGNGAAVVWLAEPLGDAVLQAVAASLNQSETAFLLRQDRHWLLRWFTPSCEVNLCGHATLAATLALGHWHQLRPGESLALHSRSGPLRVELAPGDRPAGRIVLPTAELVPVPVGAELMAYLQRHLAAAPEACWNSALQYRVVLLPPRAALTTATLPTAELPAEVRSGLVLMQALEAGKGPSVLGRASHYQLRFLAPGLGIPEDPVTGSAHALVAPWWLRQLGLREVVGWQCSHRPGGMVCEAASSGMIRLFGAGHRLWDGTLRLESWPGAGPPSGDAGPAGRAAAAWGSLLP